MSKHEQDVRRFNAVIYQGWWLVGAKCCMLTSYLYYYRGFLQGKAQTSRVGAWSDIWVYCIILKWPFELVLDLILGACKSALLLNQKRWYIGDIHANISIFWMKCYGSIVLRPTIRRKFRSQTSDNMERWNSSQQGEESEEKRSEERRCRRAKR